MNVTNRRLQDLLQTIPVFQGLDFSSTGMDMILVFESWLGLRSDFDDDNNPSIEDDVDDDDNPLSSLFFMAFVELLDWAYHTPIRPLEGISTDKVDVNSEDDFNTLESVQVTIWLRHCLELNVGSKGFIPQLLECDSKIATLYVTSLFDHMHSLSQLQATQNAYIQTLRNSMSASRFENPSSHFQNLNLIIERLQTKLTDHLQRLETILGETYAAASASIRSLCRRQFALYWYSVGAQSSVGGAKMSWNSTNGSHHHHHHHEDTRATGMAISLRVLLRILRGVNEASHELLPAHEHLLFSTLLQLHQPNSLVLWRDQTALLELYHEPLVQCMAVLLHKEPNWISPVLESIMKPPIWTISNTPKCVLLLHELDLLIAILPEGLALPSWLAVFSQLTSYMGSENSRLSEQALQLFRNERFNQLFFSPGNFAESLPLLLKAIVKPTSIPWNPTVRKRIYFVLEEIREKDTEAMAKACQVAFKPVNISRNDDKPLSKLSPKVKYRVPATATSSAGKFQIPNISTDRSCKRLMPSPSLPLPSSRGRQGNRPPIGAIGKGKAPWTTSNPPPLTITGIAPWSKEPSVPPPLTATGIAPWTASNPPPLTITGVPPWSKEPSVLPPLTTTGIAPWTKSKKTFSNQNSDSFSSFTEESEETEVNVEVSEVSEAKSSSLPMVLKYMDDIRPDVTQSGASYWSQAQMAESPTLLPNLKFHDLVFGHELGSGAFGVVRYARRIDVSRTRSHWAEYAVKIISTETITRMGYASSVQREIAILSCLSHPGIARLISSFRFRDGAYLVLEYASRGDLQTLIHQHGSLDTESTRFVLGEIVAALTSIHDLGFVYGDLKLENTLITETGHIKLTDFGACRPYTKAAKELIGSSSKNILKRLRDGDWKASLPENLEGTSTNVIVVDWNGNSESSPLEPDLDPHDEDDDYDDDYRIEGTVAYLPPEVVMGAMPSPAADMWALGCVLYQCLTGRPPLLDDNDELTRKRIVSFSHAESSIRNSVDALFREAHAMKIPDDAKGLIRRLLLRNPQERPNSGQAIANDEFFEGRDVFSFYRQESHALEAGTVAPPLHDSKWGRRQLSSIWAPQPSAYDLSISTAVISPMNGRRDDSSPIPEGDEAPCFFSFNKTF
jgi:serine/threonine protein kinase